MSYVNWEAYDVPENVNVYVDDKEEIISVGNALSADSLYGAAQMIFRLARERDEARERVQKAEKVIACARPFNVGVAEYREFNARTIHRLRDALSSFDVG